MTKKEYLFQLRQNLKHLPAFEIETAIAYYDEYFSEAENEFAAINKLGAPQTVAAKIIGEYAVSSAENAKNSEKARNAASKPKTDSSLKTLWIALIALFALPVAFPLALALFFVILALLITLFSIVLAFAATSLALGIAGIPMVISSFAVMFLHLPTGIAMLGTGLAGLGLCYFIGLGTVMLTKAIVRGLQTMIGKLLIKKGGTA
ncbi:MAG: DUF1700 domain-containing protein [Oscillospiraceae bacterium]|jgi:uncharacterized membrane protein|nr:DUF1700 domain-containing protein [Oscillospiraceae bacterium]